MKHTNINDSTQLSMADEKMLTAAGIAQGAFIIAQSTAFPSLGATGAIVASLCGLMPWVIPYFKKNRRLASIMIMVSIAIAPAFGFLCREALAVLQSFL